MANTYTLIASNTLGSNTESVTFSNIPNTYTDLVLRTSIRSTLSDTSLRIEFNANTSNVYSHTYVRGNGSVAESLAASNDTVFFTRGLINRSAYTSNTFSSSEIYIPSYTVSQNKPLSMFAAAENNATAAEYLTAIAGLFRSTAAISSIKITQGAGNYLATNSSFFLYGIKNS